MTWLLGLVVGVLVVVTQPGRAVGGGHTWVGHNDEVMTEIVEPLVSPIGP